MEDLKSQKTQPRAKEDEPAEKPKTKPQIQPPFPQRVRHPLWRNNTGSNQAHTAGRSPGVLQVLEIGQKMVGNIRAKTKANSKPTQQLQMPQKMAVARGKGQDRDPCYYLQQ